MKNKFAILTKNPGVFRAVEALALSMGYTWWADKSSIKDTNPYIGFKTSADGRFLLDTSTGRVYNYNYDKVYDHKTPMCDIIKAMNDLKDPSRQVKPLTLSVNVKFEVDILDNVVQNIKYQEINIINENRK